MLNKKHIHDFGLFKIHQGLGHLGRNSLHNKGLLSVTLFLLNHAHKFKRSLLAQQFRLQVIQNHLLGLFRQWSLELLVLHQLLGSLLPNWHGNFAFSDHWDGHALNFRPQTLLSLLNALLVRIHIIVFEVLSSFVQVCLFTLLLNLIAEFLNDQHNFHKLVLLNRACRSIHHSNSRTLLVNNRHHAFGKLSSFFLGFLVVRHLLL